MIYGEEQEAIEFSAGLWLKNFKPAKQPFCKNLKNFIIKDDGNIVARGSFFPITGSFSFSSQNRFGSNDRRPDIYNVELYPIPPVYPGILSGDDFNEPAYIHNGSGTPWVSGKHNFSGVYTYTPTGFSASPGSVDSYCLYRDRLYVIDSGTGIAKITGWDFNTSAAVTTTTPLASSPTSGIFLFTHKDRVWCIDSDGRIYFTDIATVGGYPETWDTAANFIDLPTDTDTNITGYAILNNIIYLFAPTTMYTLQVIGEPSDWILKVSPFQAQAAESVHVAFNNGVIYYYDGTDIFAFNGQSTPVKISAPITDEIDKWSAIGIFPFEDGILLNLVNYTRLQTAVGPPAYYCNQVVDSKVLYFNGNGWTEFTINTDYKWFIYNSSSRRNIAINGNFPKSIVCICFVDSIALSFVSYVYDRFSYSGDYINGVYVDTDLYAEASTVGKDIDKEKRYKYGYLNLYSELDSVDVQTVVDNTHTSTVDTYATTTVSDNVYALKIAMPGFARRLDLRVSATIPAQTSFDSCPLEINSMILVKNTARNEADDVN